MLGLHSSTPCGGLLQLLVSYTFKDGQPILAQSIANLQMDTSVIERQ